MIKVLIDPPVHEFQEGIDTGRLFAVNAGREDNAGKFAGVISGQGSVYGMNAGIGRDPAGFDQAMPARIFFERLDDLAGKRPFDGGTLFGHQVDQALNPQPIDTAGGIDRRFSGGFGCYRMRHSQAVQQVAQGAVVPHDEAVLVSPHAAVLAGADHLVGQNRRGFTDRLHNPAVNREIIESVVVGGGLVDPGDVILMQVECRDDVF